MDQTPGAADMLRVLDLGHDQLPTHNNLAPTEPVPVIFAHEGGYDLAPMRWWLHPDWSVEPPNQKFAMFNDPIDTVLTSRAYKGPIQYRLGISR
ncbi:SOS response-associated peptidase [Gilvimarinus sp. HB14]|uniref:SOS response-associated peptidase n=1 Tax=Gilvimarinus xylanilyticus TaxID=2944139 RepID=A0A9X2I3X2_9GAMM|nr:SOS response-associated peptidase [Gilvimarinus xylanilyticus]